MLFVKTFKKFIASSLIASLLLNPIAFATSSYIELDFKESNTADRLHTMMRLNNVQDISHLKIDVDEQKVSLYKKHETTERAENDLDTDTLSVSPPDSVLNLPRENIYNLPWHLGHDRLKCFLSQHTAWLTPLSEGEYKLEFKGRLLGGGWESWGGTSGDGNGRGRSDYGGGSYSSGSSDDRVQCPSQFRNFDFCSRMSDGRIIPGVTITLGDSTHESNVNNSDIRDADFGRSYGKNSDGGRSGNDGGGSHNQGMTSSSSNSSASKNISPKNNTERHALDARVQSIAPGFNPEYYNILHPGVLQEALRTGNNPLDYAKWHYANFGHKHLNYLPLDFNADLYVKLHPGLITEYNNELFIKFFVSFETYVKDHYTRYGYKHLNHLPHDFNADLYVKLYPSLVQEAAVKGMPLHDYAKWQYAHYGHQGLNYLPHDFSTDLYVKLYPGLVQEAAVKGMAVHDYAKWQYAHHGHNGMNHLPHDFNADLYLKLYPGLVQEAAVKGMAVHDYAKWQYAHHGHSHSMNYLPHDFNVDLYIKFHPGLVREAEEKGMPLHAYAKWQYAHHGHSHDLNYLPRDFNPLFYNLVNPGVALEAASLGRDPLIYASWHYAYYGHQGLNHKLIDFKIDAYHPEVIEEPEPSEIEVIEDDYIPADPQSARWIRVSDEDSIHQSEVILVGLLLKIMKMERIVKLFKLGSRFVAQGWNKATQSYTRSATDRFIRKDWQKDLDIPQGWNKMGVDKQNGVKYRLPGQNPRDHSEIRVMKGRPDSDYPGQRVDYVKLNKDGNYYDINGNIVGKKTQEAHIPLKGNEKVIDNLIKQIWR